MLGILEPPVVYCLKTIQSYSQFSYLRDFKVPKNIKKSFICVPKGQRYYKKNIVYPYTKIPSSYLKYTVCLYLNISLEL